MSLCTLIRNYAHKVRIYSLLPALRKIQKVFKTEDNVCVSLMLACRAEALH